MGDDESSVKGVLRRGDIQVWRGEDLEVAVEVKDTIVNELGWRRVEQTHGEHRYSLIVLATGYSPPSLQRDISSQRNTFALHLADFVITTVLMVAQEEQLPLLQVLNEMIEIYNAEFCEEIEKDLSIKIKLVVVETR